MTGRLVILGATGRLGSAVAHALAGWRDLTVLRQTRHAQAGDLYWDPAAGFAALQDALKPYDTVLNLIGATPAAALDEAGFDRINVDLALGVLGAARGARAGRVLMASSAAVYGRPADPARALNEDDTLAPLSPYARSKARMEAALTERAGADLTVLRIGNVAGADALLGQVAGQAGPVEITLDRFADGQGPRRSYIGPEGLGWVIGALADASVLPACLNLTAPPPLAMADLVCALDARCPGRIRLGWRPAPEGAIPQVALDHARLAGVVGDVLMPVSAGSVVDEWLSQEAMI